MQKRRGRKPRIPRSTQLQVFLDLVSSLGSYKEIAEKYEVETSYVRNLYYRWRDNPPEEIAERIKMNNSPAPDQEEEPSESTLSTLRLELAYAKLKIEALEKMIELAEETFELDIRKKSGSQQHNT